jgi:hypothetical protein
MRSTFLKRLGLAGSWSQELAVAALALALGFGALPALIFLAGSVSLGRYDGGSVGGVYDGVYRGLETGSSASWIVVFGPYGLYLLFKAFRLWWRASARLGSSDSSLGGSGR